MSPDDRRIDHQPLGIGTGGQGVEKHLPHPQARPAAKTPVRRVPVAVLLGQCAPACPVTGHPQDRLDKAPVVVGRTAWITALARQGVSDPLPLIFPQLLGITQRSLLVPPYLPHLLLNVHTA
jgi:hypothetical protein